MGGPGQPLRVGDTVQAFIHYGSERVGPFAATCVQEDPLLIRITPGVKEAWRVNVDPYHVQSTPGFHADDWVGSGHSPVEWNWIPRD